MADAKKFRFVSPGIFLNEIDQSYLPARPTIPGPVIIGRAEKGPGMIPVKIGSFSEFTNVFGYPIPGNGGVDDVWRDGNFSSPTYGGYAAQSYLRAGVGPITFIRLMGTQHQDATAAGNAGWTTNNTPASGLANNGGPYGLFVWPSESAPDATVTGSLAAVFYCYSGSVPVLSGTYPDHAVPTLGKEGTAGAIKCNSNGEHKVRILYGTSATEAKNATFSFSETSSNFVRKMFNTNPQFCNTTIEDSNQVEYYWLGETYERYLYDNSLTDASVRYATILAMTSGSNEYGNHEKRMPYRDAHSGWFFAQNTSADTSSFEYGNMQKLFKFVGINGHGEWIQNNIKISVSEIKASSNTNVKYGVFDVLIRRASDDDMAPQILERFSACSLDPSSLDYIGVKIGDRYRTWDDVEDRYRTYGRYPNRSKYVRVVINDTVEVGAADPALLPFGIYGPPRFPSFIFGSGIQAGGKHGRFDQPNTIIGEISASYVQGTGSIAHSLATADVTVAAAGGFVARQGAEYNSASIVYPAVATRSTAGSDGATATKNAYFGLHTGKSSTSTVFDPGYGDYLRAFGENVISSWTDDFGLTVLPGSLEYQWIFTLDEVIPTTGSNFSTTNPSDGITNATWTSGSMVAGTAWNAFDSLGNGAARYQNILDSKINRFTSPMFGGFDGLDILERDPFRNTRIDDSETETGNYTYYTVKRAINTVADPEVIEANILTVPGLTNESLTKYLIDVCEERADMLGVIDLKGGFQPRHESNSAISSRKGITATVLSNIKARNLNNSYGCAYYPWVQIRDDNAGTFIMAPPSVVALGTLANTERSAEVWFAPAGFQRGGLSQGAAGLVVSGVETKLTSQNRDDLYDVNINPIASFPAEGIVVFGQKTLQAKRSALDRINVRRLMIYVKRGISRISSTTLFQPNVQSTWNGFKSRADAFLGDVKVRFGVDDFRVILNGTTTTPDLVDQNIMYAKIYIKPTRAIEFIAIDFIITRSGASFND